MKICVMKFGCLHYLSLWKCQRIIRWIVQPTWPPPPSHCLPLSSVQPRYRRQGSECRRAKYWLHPLRWSFWRLYSNWLTLTLILDFMILRLLKREKIENCKLKLNLLKQLRFMMIKNYSSIDILLTIDSTFQCINFFHPLSLSRLFTLFRKLNILWTLKV